VRGDGTGARNVDPVGGSVAATERRLGRMIGLARVGTALFTVLPFSIHTRLGDPLLAVAAAVLAIGFAAVMARLCWQTDRMRDAPVVWADVAVTVLVAVVGSRAAGSAVRPQVMTELVPFCLAGAATVGFVLGAGLRGVLCTATLAGTWMLVGMPDRSLKSGSDALGFVLWYVIATLIASELRQLARQTEDAERARLDVMRRAAEDEKDELATEYREELQTTLHDRVLPILEYLSHGGSVGPAVRHEAGLVAGQARVMLERRHGDAGSAASLADGVRDVVAAMQRLDLQVTVSPLAIVDDPPPAVVAATLAACREALNNVVKHARSPDGASLYVEATREDVTVVVTDHGIGAPAGQPRAGGGLVRSTAALRRLGGECTVSAVDGGGTRVVLSWRERTGTEPTPEPAGPAPAVHRDETIAG
jgi:Histidine kinase-, DNA gyrase B-, and HSP90-like ATPase